jgi:bifunctional non-homologous end joining protein LigD
MEQTTLYYRQGASDKMYQISIEPSGDKFVVNTQYGRRGSTLRSETKTAVPVNYDAAKAIYVRLIKEKQSKGYTVGEDGTPYSHTDKAGSVTGTIPQLLNPIGHDEIGALLDDPHWWVQQKFDGERRLIKKEGKEVIGINRRGLQVDLPQKWVEDCLRCSGDFLIDGEAVNETLHVFDILFSGGEDIRESPYLNRYLHLMKFLSGWSSAFARLVRTVCVDQAKKAFFHEMKAAGAEGVVFKNIEEPYTSGRPASGGPALKHKFIETASFIVGRINAKRSVSLVLLQGDVAMNAGNVTIPPDLQIPETGTVVEVRYLYAFRESGCIYQPVYLGERADITQEECTIQQLKYKPTVPEMVA